MEGKVGLKRITNAFVLLVLLFLSNFFIGGFLTIIIIQLIIHLVFTLNYALGDLIILVIFGFVLPGPLSTWITYLIYTRIPCTKKLNLPIIKVGGYLLSQGIVMALLEPISLISSLNSPGIDWSELMIGFTSTWLLINIVLWLFFVISIMFKEKEKVL